MEFGLSEEQVLLQDSVRRFLSDNAPLDRVRAFAEQADDADIWSGLCALGIGGLIIDEAHGGVGLSYLDAALVAETLGYAATPAPFLSAAILAPSALQAASAHTDLLPDIAAGSLRIGAALAESNGARQDAGVRNSGGKLSGKALFAMGAPADRYLVVDTERQLHLVDADAARTEALPNIDATRPLIEIRLDGTPAELVADDPDVLRQVLMAGRTMLAADTLGAAQFMLDAAVAYAKEREQFNRPIASFQAVKHMCAEMAASLEPCRSMVWYAAHTIDETPQEAELMALHSKAHTSEVGKFVARTATEVHGGMGFTDLVGLHYWFKRIGFNRQILGAPEYLREAAARVQGLAA
jgi:alkylation response protein AidB-like acyl-CoA dehydrogenase